MRNFFFSQKNNKFSAPLLLATALAFLAGCSDNTATGTGTGGATGTGGTTAGTPTVTVALITNTLSTGTSTIVNATVKDAAGAAVANAIVTFSTDPAMGTLSVATALTNASGVATATLTGGATAGATTITATSQVGTAAVTGSIGYSVGALLVTMTNPAFGVSPLSAFGTTSVTVTVSSGGVPVTTPQTVTFSSPCAVSGKAALSPSVVTVNGIATGSYRDNGCAGTDTVTASVSGLASSSATLTVTTPTTGSIQFVSATPTSIALKGTGGAGRQEFSKVIFKVVDTGGNPVSGKTVSFTLSTSVGGIAFATGGITATAISGTDGQVQVTVNSGTYSTPVRVTASTCTTSDTPCTGTTLTTQSDQLTITTGIPTQPSFSVSATQHNIEGYSFDGTTSVLTARMADHFGNPVPDGTAVTFITESALVAGQPAVPGLPVGSCVTVNSACDALFTSQGLRPTNGRVTVLAYAVGEEGFTDLNSNGTVDNASEMIDVNNHSTDMGDVYLDSNENGVHDPATEMFISFTGSTSFVGTTSGLAPFNFVGATSSGDGLYHGVLCTLGAAICSPQKSIFVRDSQIIVLSTSHADITINGGAAIALPPCVTGIGGSGHAGAPTSFTVTVVDLNGNAMPAGTTVAFSSTNGTITFPVGGYTVQDTIGCRAGYAGCPAFSASATFGDHTVSMKSDSVFAAGAAGSAGPPVVPPAADTCTDPTGSSGMFTVTVTTPKGNITSYYMPVTD